jgi:hypothetical protein
MVGEKGERHSELIDRTNSIGIDFLRTDLRAALTFIQVAETSSSWESRDRNYRKALEGYRAVVHFLPRLVPSPKELAEIETKLEEIKLQLERAGFPVSS